jgi:hypothetical protein
MSYAITISNTAKKAIEKFKKSNPIAFKNIPRCPKK